MAVEDSQRPVPADAGPPAQADEPVLDAQADARAPDGDFHDSSIFRWRGGASLVVAALFGVLGLMVVAGAIAESSDDALANARPDELVQILDSLDSENDRLEAEKRQLTAEIESLASGRDAAALEQARARREALEVLAGTTGVRGPGVRIVIRDRVGGVDAPTILDAVQELRDAGADSIEVAERRVVVGTWFADPGEEQRPGILISGDLRNSPYTILAIGDPETLATAMEIPGGVADTIRTAGADFQVDRRDELEITSTVPLVQPEYAVPADQG
ncbi:MAG: DUF881 domain-containing protein [Candidatus Nanopelagicales bacterium]